MDGSMSATPRACAPNTQPSLDSQPLRGPIPVNDDTDYDVDHPSNQPPHPSPQPAFPAKAHLMFVVEGHMKAAENAMRKWHME